MGENRHRSTTNFVILSKREARVEGPAQTPIRRFMDSSPNLFGPPPILAWTNDRNSLNYLHMEKISIDADQKRAISFDCGTQHRQVGRVPTKTRRQFGGLDDKADSTQKGDNLTNVAPGIVEFLNEFSRQFIENEF